VTPIWQIPAFLCARESAEESRTMRRAFDALKVDGCF
jgi:hypothetical protein